MNYIYLNGKEYVNPQVVADHLCSLNVFTKQEKKKIQNEVKLYPQLVESRVLLFPDWYWLLDKRIS